MKINLLYIGNKLSIHGNTATSIETLGSFLEQEGYNLFYSSSQKNKVLRLLDMIYSTLSKGKKVDYVLIDTYSTQNFWFAFIISQICRILRVKYITKLHGGDLPNRLKKSPFFCDLLFANAYKITAPSAYLFDAFSERYSANLMYIPNTIEIENYHFEQRTFHCPKLLWVRSFSSIYNPKMAIKVLAALKKEYSDAVLYMVGPDKENLIEDCRLFAQKLNVEVHFTGKLEKEEWLKLAKYFNFFINTTHFDNTPVSVIEAMALGLPVISTNVGGIPFLLADQQTAMLVPDSDVDAMVLALKNLIADEALRLNIVKNARQMVENFDWQIVKHQWFDILK